MQTSISYNAFPFATRLLCKYIQKGPCVHSSYTFSLINSILPQHCHNTHNHTRNQSKNRPAYTSTTSERSNLPRLHIHADARTRAGARAHRSCRRPPSTRCSRASRCDCCPVRRLPSATARGRGCGAGAWVRPAGGRGCGCGYG